MALYHNFEVDLKLNLKKNRKVVMLGSLSIVLLVHGLLVIDERIGDRCTTYLRAFNLKK